MQTPTWRESAATGRMSDRATAGAVVAGRYALRTPIGTGGMGTVWRATDTLLNRDVAVKEVLLPPNMPVSEQNALCERTLREARAAASLSHPSVVQVYDVVTDDGRPWIVMELLEARSLADMVIEDGPLSARAVAKIGIAMLGALEVAHAAGVLHRDVKPANVLICGDGRCVLTDFGVARLPQESNLTTPGMVLGSPHFISPERAIGSAFGPPSDLFSLGVTLFTAVEGAPPFDRGDPFETMRAVVEEAPLPPRLAGPLTPVLWGLLEKDPARRWTVAQARSALRELLAGPLSRSGHHTDTDPYAVIPPPTSLPPEARPASPGAKVGGRAMLSPDEPLTGQLAQLREGRGAGTRPPASPATAGGPTGAWPPPGSGDATGAWSLDESTGAWPAPGDVPPTSPGGRRANRRRPTGEPAGPLGNVTGGARGVGQRIRRAPTRLVVIGGLVVVLAVVTVGTATGWFSGSSPAASPGPTASTGATPTPLIDVQVYHDSRGITVNVPKDWKKSAGGSYVDFVDPDSSVGERKIRINVEKAPGTPTEFLQAAERYLKKNCTQPYHRVALRETSLADQNAAELEYTCGSGSDMRHGIWRAIVVNGKAYHFYLTVPDSQFDDSLNIYREMVRSFHLDL